MSTAGEMQNDSASVLTVREESGVRAYVRSGAPYVWTTAAAIAASIVIVGGLLGLILVRGMSHFWPSNVMVADYQMPERPFERLMAEVRSIEEVSSARLLSAGLPVDPAREFYDRWLVKVGNRDLYGADFRYLVSDWIVDRNYPRNVVVLERMEWGNFHGTLQQVKQAGAVVASGEEGWTAYLPLQERTNRLRKQATRIERYDIGDVNYGLERLRLERRRLELLGQTPDSHPEVYADLERRREALDAEYLKHKEKLDALRAELARDSIVMRTVQGNDIEIPLAKIVRGYRPNAMSVLDKLGFYFAKLWEFVADAPREANTEGGIAPAIFGTVLMTLIMSVFVTPFGVVAALYLREYARQGLVTRAIRVAVNNLAGVPSIVFGIFGLGFFVYFLGGAIDKAFYPEAAPAPMFGTPGLLWASLTLALLTLPVVIVATEEGLARIPRSIREASLALGATKAETLWRVVLPMASPAMMTGLILAIARAAGEVAPLMLVGVVKLAPTLPLDGNFPFMHLERKFMHLGFHIYDVGFQSPNVEAARPLVYATSFLLVMVILVLNLTAVSIRNRLRERYRALEN
jgi:phosphate transport system permease protein